MTRDQSTAAELIHAQAGQLLGEIGSLAPASRVLEAAPGPPAVAQLDPAARLERIVAAAKPRPRGGGR